MAITQSKPAGSWTYDDLFSLPEDGKRYEIIEGELYEMPGPSVEHQITLVNLILLLAPIVQGLGGRLLSAPLDIFLPGADPVQPDILIILPGGNAKRTRLGFQGAPDFLIEILSPGNRGHDLLRKRALYARGGVREYWLVDPERRTVDVLRLEGDAFITAQTASGEDIAMSPMLGGAAFPLAEIFAGVDEDDLAD